MILNALLFALGIGVLIKSADFFTTFSEKLGKRWALSPFALSVGILSLGSVLPELSTSLLASYEEQSGLVLATVLGSNTVHVLLLLGLSAGLSKKALPLASSDASFLFASSAWLVLTLMDGTLHRMEALLGLGLYALFILKKKQEASPETLLAPSSKGSFQRKELGGLLLSGFGLFLGARLALYGMTSLSEIMDISASWVALMIFSFGLALPELAVSFATARQKRVHENRLSQILVSNILNVSVVMGLAGLIRPLQANLDLMTVSLFFLVFSTLLVLVASFQQELSRWYGALLMLLYLLYVYHNLILLF